MASPTDPPSTPPPSITGETTTTTQESKKAITDLIEGFNELTKERQKSVDVLKQEIAQLNEEKKYYNDIGEGMERLNGIMAKRLQIIDKLIEQEKAKPESNQDQLNQLNNVRRAFEALNDIQSKTPKTLGDAIQVTFLYGRALDNAKEQVKNLANADDELKKSLGEVESAYVKMAGEFAKQKIDSAFSQLISTVRSAITMIDSYNVSLNKTYVGQSAFIESTKQLADANLQLGISLDETKAAQLELSKGYSGFNVIADDTTQGFSKQISTFQALGISTGVYVKNLEVLSRALKMTGADATAINDKLVSMSAMLGISADQIGQDFQAASSVVGFYGPKMMEVFAGLENVAVKTGISMSNLLSITKKFDTFQGAAESAGKLNAILGGALLNSSQLLAASEDERLKLLYEAVNASGKDFEKLQKYEQLSIATAAGFNDVNEARKFFAMSSAEFNNAMEVNNLQQLEYNDLLEKSKTANEKWQMATMQLAVALSPIAEFLSSFAGLVSQNKYVVYGLAAAITVLGVSLMILSGLSKLAAIRTVFSTAELNRNIAAIVAQTQAQAAQQPVTQTDTANKTANANATNAQTGALQRQIPVQQAAGNAASLSAGQIKAFGVAILAAGIGIGIAAAGLGFLVISFKHLTGQQIVGGLTAIAFVLIGFVAMLYILTIASTAATVPLTGLGIAMLLIGGGIFLAALGLSKFVNSLSNLSAKQITAISFAIGALALAIAAMALLFSTPLTAVGLLGMIAVFLTLGFAINRINTNVVQALATLASYGTQLREVADSIFLITDAIKSLPEASLGVVLVTRYVDTLTELSQNNPLDTVELFKQTANVTPTTIQNVREMTNEISRLNTEINIQSTTNNSFEQLVTAIKEETAMIKKALENPINVDVSIDKRSVGRTVFSLFDGVTTKATIPTAVPAGSGQ